VRRRATGKANTRCRLRERKAVLRPQQVGQPASWTRRLPSAQSVGALDVPWTIPRRQDANGSPAEPDAQDQRTQPTRGRAEIRLATCRTGPGFADQEKQKRRPGHKANGDCRRTPDTYKLVRSSGYPAPEYGIRKISRPPFLTIQGPSSACTRLPGPSVASIGAMGRARARRPLITIAC